jgi:hypothetical protein
MLISRAKAVEGREGEFTWMDRMDRIRIDELTI